jgi:hypothetical protein
MPSKHFSASKEHLPKIVRAEWMPRSTCELLASLSRAERRRLSGSGADARYP